MIQGCQALSSVGSVPPRSPELNSISRSPCGGEPSGSFRRRRLPKACPRWRQLRRTARLLVQTLPYEELAKRVHETLQELLALSKTLSTMALGCDPNG